MGIRIYSLLLILLLGAGKTNAQNSLISLGDSLKNLKTVNALKQSLVQYQHSIVELVPDFSDKVDLSNNPQVSDLSSTSNRALLLEVLNKKASTFEEIYPHQPNDIGYWEVALETYQLAATLIDKMLVETPDKFYFKEGLTTYKGGIKIAYELYAKTGNNDYKAIAWRLMESSRHCNLAFKSSHYDIPLASIEEVQADLLDTKSACMEYFTTDSSIYTMMIAKNKSEFYRTEDVNPSDWNELKNLLKEDKALFKSENGHKYVDKIQLLHQQLQLHRINDKQSWIIIPDEALSWIPFDDLVHRVTSQDGKNSVDNINENKLSYGLSASRSVWNKQKEPTTATTTDNLTDDKSLTKTTKHNVINNNWILKWLIATFGIIIIATIIGLSFFSSK